MVTGIRVPIKTERSGAADSTGAFFTMPVTFLNAGKGGNVGGNEEEGQNKLMK